MIGRFILAVLHSIYDGIRFKILLHNKKEIDKSQFDKLKKKINTKFNYPKKKTNNKVLVASFVHQLGYVYTECLLANYISKIKNLKIIGLMDDEDNMTKKFLRSFNSVDNTFLKRLNLFNKFKYLYRSYKILKKNRTVENFIKFKLNNIDIGEIVYDHYIRNSNNPSAESLNYKFIIFLAEGLYVNDFIKKFFKKNKINYMVMAEKQFIPSNIIFQNALKFGVKVVSRISGPKDISLAIFKSFKEKNDSDVKLQKKFLKYFYSRNKTKYAKKGLKSALRMIDRKTRHPDHNIKDNAKKIKSVENFYKQLELNPKKKTCFIFSHNLLDGVNGGKSVKVFKDYLTWLRETLLFINKLNDDINWVIKEHPSDYGFDKMNTNTKIEFEDLIDRNKKNIKFFPDNFDQSIIRDVASCVITQGGSSGMEYPCFGIHSVNSSGIFYSDKNFTHNYKSKKEYFNLLENMNKILKYKLPKKQIKIARVHFFLSYILIRYKHPLLYQFDITRNLSSEEFFKEILKLINKYDQKKDKFEIYFKQLLYNKNKHLINSQKI